MIINEERLAQAIEHMHEPLAGRLCLDFANTLEPRGGPPPISPPPEVTFRDELSSYDELIGWAAHKRTISQPSALTLLQRAEAAPERAQAILTRARDFRDVIYRTFWAIANDKTPASADLDAIMREYADATAHARLEIEDSGVLWTWSSEDELARPLWPVAHSAVDLLTTGDHRRIKVCPGPGRPPVACAWLFYDTTKNGSRRWCSMADCGAVTKARLQTARRRAQRHDPEP